MTIAEKSTELGIDLAQIALDKYGVSKCKINDAFHCFTTKGGEVQNIYIHDDNDVKVHDGYFRWDDNTLAETTDTPTVKQAFKDYINAQEFIAVNNDSVVYEDLV